MTDGTPTGGKETATAGSSTTLEPTSASTSFEGGPIFISLQTNVTKLTSGQSVIFTAVVTDPDGLDDIVGGTLSSQDEMIGYGAFIAAGPEGTYTIEISWDAMQQAESIEFLQSELIRTFRVAFFDQGAHSSAQDVEVTLFCAEGSACAGICTDVLSDGENCGVCGKTCKGGPKACGNAECLPAFGECINKDAGFATCIAYCAGIGETCAENSCGTNDTILAYGLLSSCENSQSGNTVPEPCDTVQPWSAGRVAVRCCCSDTQ